MCALISVVKCISLKNCNGCVILNIDVEGQPYGVMRKL